MNTQNNFAEVLTLNWKTVLSDDGKADWTKNWTLDGENSRVYNHPRFGMEVYSGARILHDADHTVLWTKSEFSGDVKISYEYTRLDNAERCVNIMYMMATGGEHDNYESDISKWADLRKIPAMRTYFNNMNLYHISYAAFGMDDTSRYIRARRYCCTEQNGPIQTPDYDPEDFFAPMQVHNLTFIKKGDMLYFHIKNDEKEKLCSWQLQDGGELTKGRIGLRQMFTRNARYKNIEICTLSES